MTQDERRKYLIEYLLKEEIRFRAQEIPKDKKGQENLLRSLMNVRLSGIIVLRCSSRAFFLSSN